MFRSNDDDRAGGSLPSPAPVNQQAELNAVTYALAGVLDNRYGMCG